MKKDVERRLRNEFIEAYTTAERDYKFKSPIFIRMLNDHGAYETAKRLTDNPLWQSGYEKLAALGRTDLTVEHIILKPEYSIYFTDKQIHNAREKIKVASQILGHHY